MIKHTRQKNTESGAVMMIAVIFFVVIATLVVLGLTGPSAREYKTALDSIAGHQSYFFAESDAEDIYYRIKTGSSTSPTENLVLGSVMATSTLATITGGQEITSIATVAGQQRKVDLQINGGTRTFKYATMVGVGGVKLNTGNVSINGDLYSLGPIIGVGGSTITGGAWSPDTSALYVDQSNGTSTPTYDVSFGNTGATNYFAQSFRVSQTNPLNKISLYLKKNGTPGDAIIQVVSDNGGVPNTTVIATGMVPSAYTSTVYSWVDVTFSQQQMLLKGDTYWIVIKPTSNSSNYYTVGASPSGLYPNGLFKIGTNALVWNDPLSSTVNSFFKIYLGGTVGSIAGTSGNSSNPIYIGSTASDNVWGSAVSYVSTYGKIFCSTGTGNNKSCTSGSTTVQNNYPISEKLITQWKNDATAGGVLTGTRTVPNFGGSTFGPKKINGDLVVNGILTMTGTVWVTGNITFSGTGKIKLTPGYGANSGILIVDGRIVYSGSGFAYGSGTAGSYLMIVSTNTSVGSTPAAQVSGSGSTNSVIMYAPYGEVSWSTGNFPKSVVGYQVSLSGDAIVDYDSNLGAVNFLSAVGVPSVSYNISSWKEMQ